MKVLWSSPWFGNYRIPVYEELNNLTEGNFYLVCSKCQTSALVQTKLKDTLGGNVAILDKYKEFKFGDTSSDMANKAIIIKWQQGLYAHCKKINPDVVIVEGFGSWAPYGVLYSIMHRKKLCMFYERTKHTERFARKFNTNYRKFIGRFVDTFLINGNETKAYLRDVLNFTKTPCVKGCMAADSKGLANAVKTVTSEEKEDIKMSLNIKGGLTYLFVGQLVIRKGIKEFVSAWRKHAESYPDDNLIAIGSGILKDKVKASSADTPSIHILGEIPYDQIHKYYGLADVFVMPTLEDNWCLVLPEAMACGLPVACTIYNGGTSELIKDGENGFSFDPLNESEFVDTLAKFHNADLKAMGQKSIEIESNFTPEKSAKKMYEACLKLMKK